jgi:hypothetical protein
MICPPGANPVAGVIIDFGAPLGSAISVRGMVPNISMASSEMVEAIRAYPKYSPDLFAEKIKYTFSADCFRISTIDATINFSKKRY